MKQNLLCKQVFDGSVGSGEGREEKQAGCKSMREKGVKRSLI